MDDHAKALHTIHSICSILHVTSLSAWCHSLAAVVQCVYRPTYCMQVEILEAY
jgi:putative copper export protein